MNPRKRNDTYPVIFTLKDKDGGVDLTNAATLTFIMTNTATGTIKIQAAATPDPDQTNNPGKASYSPTVDDFDTAGRYKVEFEVVWTDTTQSTWPSDGYEILVVLPDLDDA